MSSNESRTIGNGWLLRDGTFHPLRSGDNHDALAKKLGIGDWRADASTQINLPSDLAEKVVAAGAAIPDEDLGKDGRELEAHVTIKFGVDGEDEEALREAVKDSPQFEVVLGSTAFFPPRNEDGTPVILEVELSDELKKLHEVIMEAVGIVKDQFPYAPHITLAYVKDEATAKKYAGNDSLKGEKFTATSLVLSKLDGSKVAIPLGGEKFVSPLLQGKSSSVKTTAEIGPVYHGTPNMFDEFSPQEVSNRSMSGLFGIAYTVKTHAYFFTPDSGVAWNWAKNRVKDYYDKKYVKKCYITLNNPIDFRTSSWIDENVGQPDLAFPDEERSDKKPRTTRLTLLEELRELLGNFRWQDYGIDADKLRVDEPGLEWKLLDNKNFVDAIRHLGYDGAICDEGEGEFGGISYAVFSPNQIRVVNTHTGARFTSHLLTAKLPNVDMEHFKDVMRPMLPRLVGQDDLDIVDIFNETSEDTGVTYELDDTENGNPECAKNYISGGAFDLNSGQIIVRFESGIYNLFDEMDEISWRNFLGVLSAVVAHEATHNSQFSAIFHKYQGDQYLMQPALNKLDNVGNPPKDRGAYLSTSHKIAAHARHAVEELRKAALDIFYHGTSWDAADRIKTEGLKAQKWYAGPGKYVWCTLLEKEARGYGQLESRSSQCAVVTFVWPYNKTKPDPEHYEEGDLYRRISVNIPSQNIIDITYYDDDGKIVKTAATDEKLSPPIALIEKDFGYSQKEIESEYEVSIGNLWAELKTLPFPLKVYRAINVDAWDKVDLQKLGTYWSVNSAQAKSHWYRDKNKQDFVVTAVVNEENVDWLETIINRIRNTREEEVTLKKGQEIRIIAPVESVAKTAYNKLSPNQPGKEYVEETNGYAVQYDRREGDEAYPPLEKLIPQMFKESAEDPYSIKGPWSPAQFEAKFMGDSDEKPLYDKTAAFTGKSLGWLTTDGIFHPLMQGEIHKDAVVRLGLSADPDDTLWMSETFEKGAVRVSGSRFVDFEFKESTRETRALIHDFILSNIRSAEKITFDWFVPHRNHEDFYIVEDAVNWLEDPRLTKAASAEDAPETRAKGQITAQELKYGAWFLLADGSWFGLSGRNAEHSWIQHLIPKGSKAIRVPRATTFDMAWKPTEQQRQEMARLVKENPGKVYWDIYCNGKEVNSGQGSWGEYLRTLEKVYGKTAQVKTAPVEYWDNGLQRMVKQEDFSPEQQAELVQQYENQLLYHVSFKTALPKILEEGLRVNTATKGIAVGESFETYSKGKIFVGNLAAARKWSNTAKKNYPDEEQVILAVAPGALKGRLKFDNEGTLEKTAISFYTKTAIPASALSVYTGKTAATYQNKPGRVETPSGFYAEYNPHLHEEGSNTWHIFAPMGKLEIPRQMGEITLDFYADAVSPHPSIRLIQLKPEYIGKGIGRAIVKEIAKFYEGLTSDPQGVTSDMAVSMWKGLGGEKVPTDKNTKGYFYQITGAVNFSSATRDFLDQWSHGNNQAPRKLVSSVLDELKKTVTESSYTLYRGYKFDSEFWAKEKFGIDWDTLKEGQTVSLSMKSPTSWSKSKDIAEKFADPKYNSFAGQMYEDVEIRDLGIEEGDEIGLSLLVEATIPATNIIADLSQVSPNLIDNKDEQEVIVKGDVTAKVVMLRRVNWDPEDEPEENYADFEPLTPVQQEALKRLTEESMRKDMEKNPHLYGIKSSKLSVAAQAPLQAAQHIMNEFLKEFWPDLPAPKLTVVNHTRPDLLGSCKWSSEDPDTSVIEIQKSATGVEETLKRVILHELCHAAEYYNHHRILPLTELKSVESIYGHHGKWWQDEARKVNARYGANFVTKISDAAMVVNGK